MKKIVYNEMGKGLCFAINCADALFYVSFPLFFKVRVTICFYKVKRPYFSKSNIPYFEVTRCLGKIGEINEK